MNNEDRMIKIYRRVYSAPRLVLTLKALGILSVLYVVGVFAYGISVLLYSGEYLYALLLAVMAAVPFAAVTFMRLCINAPRPYEVFDIEELAHLGAELKKGRSFPSRHVFSAFLIGVLWLPYSLAFGIAALLAGVFLAAERVLLGIHFIKDVTVGAVVGAVSGLIGVLIL